MAYVTTVTIGTSNKVSVDYQSQEVSVSVTYQLERSDEDLQAFVETRTAEVEQAHSLIWRRIRELRSEQKAREAEERGQQPAEPRAERPARKRKGTPDPWPAEPVSNRQPLPVAVNGGPVAGNGHHANGTATAVAEAPVATLEPPTMVQPELPEVEEPTPQPVDAEPAQPMSTVAQHRALLTLANRAGLTDDGLAELLATHCGKRSLDDLTKYEAAQLLMHLQRGDR